jgi:uncharacterized protein DUF4180
MSGSFIQIGGVQLYYVSENGHELRTGQDAVDLMSAASEQRAAWIAIPVSRLGDAFFELRTRIAGEVAQKFAMYGAKVAILGDISSRVAKSHSLASFVAEANRGESLWFVESREELEDRFNALQSRMACD